MVTIDEIVDPSTVQLGFSEPLHDYPIGHSSAGWNDWDGGQIGGKPSWLNPRHLPKEPMKCLKCSTDLRFICQLYAPADHVTLSAFHRSFYVFACPTCCCNNAYDNSNNDINVHGKQDGLPSFGEGSVRVLRTQLEEENEYYPSLSEDEASPFDWNQHLPSTHGVEICEVCGQRGQGKCPIQGVSFCSRSHQKEYKRFAFQKSDTFLPSVYTKSELAVDEEPPAEEADESERKDATISMTDDDDPDLDLEQDDLDDATGKKYKTTHDPTTMEFSARIKRAPDQCLRYYPQWGGKELWILPNPIPNQIPNCPYCGADRKCEFQIMPQMLYHLLEDHRQKLLAAKPLVVPASTNHALSVAAAICESAAPENVPPALKDCHDDAIAKIQNHLFESKELDWGVIAVYTCTASCGTSDDMDQDLGAYREEYAWTQPPL